MLRRNTVMLSLSMTAVGIILVVVSLLSSLTGFAFVNPVSAATSNGLVTGNVIVNSACTISLTNTILQFGGSSGVPPGTTSSPANQVTDTNGGNANSYIWTDAGNWIGPQTTNNGNFLYSNTLWGATNSPVTAEVYNNTSTNTAIFLPAPTLGSAGTVNNIYFKVSVPIGTAAGTFLQQIVITNTC